VGDIGRTEGRSAFRKLIQESVPANLQTRTLRLLDSIVFGAEPILRGLEYFEVRYGSGQPTTTDYPDEGYGVYINEDDDSAWVVLHWRGEFFVIGGSGSASLPVHTHDHETDLTNVGTNTHAQIDTHIGDSTIHFLSSTIDYALVSGNDGDTDITGAELEELTDGSATSLHSHADDCPEYKYIKALAQSEGNIHLSDATNWNTSLALIKAIHVTTLSTDWDGWILRNDNGYLADDANIPALQIMDNGNGNYAIEFDLPYEDEDASDEVHLYLIDNSGSATFDVFVLGYGLK